MTSYSNAKVVLSSKRPLKQMTCVCVQFVCSQEKSFAIFPSNTLFSRRQIVAVHTLNVRDKKTLTYLEPSICSTFFTRCAKSDEF